MNTQRPITAIAIRAWRALEETPTRAWVDWAVEQLQAGYDGSNLRILAGLVQPLDYFETIRYVDGALAELELSQLDKAASIQAYSHELVAALAAGDAPMGCILSELRDLCIATDYSPSLVPFYLLFFAKQDLDNGDVQFYWDGADASNINAIITDEARKWLSECAA